MDKHNNPFKIKGLEHISSETMLRWLEYKSFGEKMSDEQWLIHCAKWRGEYRESQTLKKTSGKATGRF